MFDVNFNEELKIITHSSLSKASLRLRAELADKIFTSHFALFSSGTTTSELKGYILSEKAMEANARAVNEWFSLSSQDVWGLSLPTYHVGGLSVLLRAKLLGNRIVDLRKWHPDQWFKSVKDEKVTITTIVPTQLYDIVAKNLQAPPGLRFLIVGGDFLPLALEEKARDLGWPVIRTYGMTEVSSQLASGKVPGDKLSVLSIHEVRTNALGTLQVKSPSLFSATFTLSENFSLTMADKLCDAEGFYTTQDQVHLSEGFLTPKGRLNQEIKIAGHLTNILNLKDTLASLLLREGQYGNAELLIASDPRKGNRLVLLHRSLPDELLDLIRKSIRPAQIDEVRVVESFQRTDLGKLKNNQST